MSIADIIRGNNSNTPPPTTAELKAALQKIKSDVFRDWPWGFKIVRNADGECVDIVPTTEEERKRIDEDALLDLDEPFDD